MRTFIFNNPPVVESWAHNGETARGRRGTRRLGFQSSWSTVASGTRSDESRCGDSTASRVPPIVQCSAMPLVATRRC